MLTYNQLNEIVINSFLNLKFNYEPKRLYQPINYILSIGGKRVRPILTLAGCNVFNDDINQAIKPSIAVEIFHNFTLVHDDIMDNADIRRGKQTVHKVWDNNIAILSGDAMTVIAYQHLACVDQKILPNVLDIFNAFALGICEGQQYDMDFESQPNVTRDDYLKMIELKTSILLKGALQIGAVIGGASEGDVDRIGEFGRCLGIAFQLQDDLLDTYGDVDTFGKNIGGDIVANKKTILTIEAIKMLETSDKEIFMNLMSNKTIEREDKIKQVTSLYDKINVKAITESYIDVYFQKAIDSLNSISVADERKVTLKEIAQKLMSRKS